MKAPAVQKLRARALKLGLWVKVKRDDGSVEETVVAEEPWQLSSGQWVVGLDGIPGGYDVMRVLLSERNRPPVVSQEVQGGAEA